MTLLMGFAFVGVVFFTSMLSGVFGMAGGLVLLWFLLVVFPASTAMAVHGVIQLTANASRAWLSRRFIVWRIVALMALGVLSAAGLLLLFNYTPNAATVSLLIGLLPILVWTPKHWFQLDAHRASHAFCCGIASGGLTIAAGVSGPLIDIFFVRSQMDRRQVVATKAMIQVVAHSIKILFYLGAALALSAGVEHCATGRPVCHARHANRHTDSSPPDRRQLPHLDPLDRHGHWGVLLPTRCVSVNSLTVEGLRGTL
ncbi:TSUP family transporter [Halomonas sp. LY9]